MGDRFIEQGRQRRRHADAAVGTQRRTLGLHPSAVDTGADGIVLEVELHVGILLADHIHVRLENHGRMLLVAGRGGLAHNDVADLVGTALDAVFAGEGYQILPDLLLLLRRTGDARNGVELLPDELRFQIGDFRHSRCFYEVYFQ